ncbi:uncharacterized protein PAC_11468 [Phialocephala subalpina]|uniref:Secreted protein n=1 Tax=Phialocephala subalpina TaxID=576137 RepID=A0A1L7X972_9HELO|nr:uncharacterized protein PAC_11468 [Phialocephala subalpina]
MSVSELLVPNHTGNTVYTTPEQSPSALNIHDPFSNPEGLDELEEEPKDSKEVPRANGSHLHGQNGITASAAQKGPPEIPARPAGYELSTASNVKEPPQVPARPPTQPSDRPPKPTTPDLPKRAAPTPLRQRITIPPPTIVEDDVFTSEEGGPGSLKYTRDPQKLIAYLIPLAKPKLSKNTENEDALPERYLIYTPPQPHFLKPAKGVKEPKKHWCKRKLQEETNPPTKKHSEVDEIVLVFPSSVTHTIPEVRSEFIAQINRTKKKASKEAAISTFLLPITLAIDTFAAVIWPFGGLFEIDAVWTYASVKGWHTSLVMQKRLGARDSRFGIYGGKERNLYIRFQQDEKMNVLRRYLAECCHKKDPKMFDSAGPPPTETQVLNAIGWAPVVRGKTGGVRVEGENGWDDEEWQRTAFKNDFRATMEKGANSWGKWAGRFEKNPEKVLKK